MAIAQMLLEDEQYPLSSVRKWYEGLPPNDVIDFEERWREQIASFIELPDSRRDGFLKKAIRGPNEGAARLLFLVLAIIGAQRSAEVIDLRDQFASSLAPGRGNRITVADVYRFAHAVSDTFVYAWPGETFRNMGEYGDIDDEEED